MTQRPRSGPWPPEAWLASEALNQHALCWPRCRNGIRDLTKHRDAGARACPDAGGDGLSCDRTVAHHSHITPGNPQTTRAGASNTRRRCQHPNLGRVNGACVDDSHDTDGLCIQPRTHRSPCRNIGRVCSQNTLDQRLTTTSVPRAIPSEMSQVTISSGSQQCAMIATPSDGGPDPILRSKPSATALTAHSAPSPSRRHFPRRGAARTS
jgi:hypothetical protein